MSVIAFNISTPVKISRHRSSFLSKTCLPARTSSLHRTTTNRQAISASTTNTPKPETSISRTFFSPPSSPPTPRPLTHVILLSSLTGTLWYGWYKFCTEEDLLSTLESGPGGYLALTPFVIGVTSPAYLPTGGPAELGVALGVAWIVAVQYSLYKRINKLCDERGLGTVLCPHWVVIPGFNLIVGLRSVHFLAVAFGADESNDWMVNKLPFLGVRELNIRKMLTTPKLWLNI